MDKLNIPGEIPSDDNITYIFPLIKSTNRSGKTTNWRIIVRIQNNNDDFIPIINDYFNNQLPKGFKGWIKVISSIADGEIRATTPDIITTGKNIGKANATNVFTQALKDAHGKYKKQYQKSTEKPTSEPTGEPEIKNFIQNIVENPSEQTVDPATKLASELPTVNNNTLYPPMLAQKLDNQKKTLDFTNPIFVQRKFNGVRAISTMINNTKYPNIIIYSRSRHEYHVFDHIKAELKPFFEFYNKEFKGKYEVSQLFLDGEIYNHDMNLQEISGLARQMLIKESSSENKIAQLKYYIYDCFVVHNGILCKNNFLERNSLLNDLFSRFPGKDIVHVKTYRVHNMDEINNLYKEFLSEKYEGAMIRLNTPYEFSYNDYHSKQLLKLKPRFDEEFEIIDYSSGIRGKSKGILMFVLKTLANKTFTIKPGGISNDELKQLYDNMSKIEKNNKTIFENKYKGKKITILFDEYSKDNIPVRATTDGIIIRDYE